MQRRLSERASAHEREASARVSEAARLRRQVDAGKRRVAELEAEARAAKALAKVRYYAQYISLE